MRLAMWGSNDASLQGFFDSERHPAATRPSPRPTYQIAIEAIDPLYILSNSVGPYAQGQVAPSGTLRSVTLSNLSAGSTQTVTVTATGSASGGLNDAIGSESQPRTMPAGGQWVGRLSQIGQTDWFTFPVRGNRIFTVVTQAIGRIRLPRPNSKAMPSIGIWDAFDPVGSYARRAPPAHSTATLSVKLWLQRHRPMATTLFASASPICAAMAVPITPTAAGSSMLTPYRLRACLPSGGPITIQGMGFRLADTVLVGGQPAQVISISPNQITAIAPPAASGVTGSVDVEVDDQPSFYCRRSHPVRHQL